MDGKRAVLYARVSSDDARKTDGRNLGGQVAMCQAYAEEHGYTVVAILSEDDRGASGAAFELPQLNRLREMAQAGQFDVLVVREIDRLSRRLAKQLLVEEELSRAGVRVEYVLGNYEDTPEGALMKNVRAVVAEYERDKINERMTRGRYLKARAGHVVSHGRAPYGYRLGDADGKASLVVEESEAQVVRQIFEWYTAGDGDGVPLAIEAIARRLSDLRVPTFSDKHASAPPKTRGYGAWGPSTIRNMLRNETYAGRFQYGKRRHTANGTVHNDSEAFVTVQVPAIVDPAVFEAAQRRRAYNRQHAKRNARHDYLLSGRVRCASCGSAMTGMTKRTTTAVYRYYRCLARADLYAKPCELRVFFRADHVDALVWEWLRSILTDPAKLAEGLADYEASGAQAAAALEERLALLRDLEAQRRERMDRLLNVYLAGEVDHETWLNAKAMIEPALRDLQRERQEAEAELAARAATQAELQGIAAFADDVAAGLESAEEDFALRRRIVELLDVRAVLGQEEGRRVVSVRCRLGDGRLPIEGSTPCSAAGNDPAAIILTARLELSDALRLPAVV